MCRGNPSKREAHVTSFSPFFFSDWSIPNEFRSSQMKSDGRNKHPSHHRDYHEQRKSLLWAVLYPSKIYMLKSYPPACQNVAMFGDKISKEVSQNEVIRLGLNPI